jgi:hypothetical protein
MTLICQCNPLGHVISKLKMEFKRKIYGNTKRDIIKFKKKPLFAAEICKD